MEIGSYQIQERLALYWLAGIIVVVGGLSVFFVDLLDFSSQEDEGIDLSIEPENSPMEASSLSRIKVYNSKSEVYGAEVRLNGGYIGETNRDGAILFEVPEEAFTINASINGTSVTREIEVGEESSPNEDFDGPEDDESGGGSGDSDSSDSDGDSDSDNQDDQDSGDEEAFTGIKLENDPVADEINQLTLLEEGEALQAKVALNEDSLGETTSAGTLTFTVPNAKEITLEAKDIQETFEVEGYEKEQNQTISGDINPVIQKSGPEYVGEKVTFDASGTSSENEIESFTWNITGPQNKVMVGETIEYEVKEKGVYDVDLTVEDVGGFTEQETSFIDAKPEYKGPEIYMNQPRPGDILEAETEFEFQVDNAREGQKANIIFAGQKIEFEELDEGLNILEDPGLTVPLSSTGEASYYVEVSEQGNKWSSDSWNIENTRAYGQFGDFTVLGPENKTTSDENIVDFKFNFDLDTDVKITIQGEEPGTENTQNFRIQESVPENAGNYTVAGEIESGEYEWTAEIKPYNTTETPKESEPRTLTVN